MYCGIFPEVERPEPALDRSYPSSANVKNEWKNTSTPNMPLLGMNRDKFSFTFFDLVAGPIVKRFESRHCLVGCCARKYFTTVAF